MFHTFSLTISVSLVLLAVLLALAKCMRAISAVKERRSALGSSSHARACLLPPGPRPWPVLGSLPLMALFRNPWEGFASLRHRYGDIFAIQLGSQRCVVVNSSKSMREILVTKAGDFGGRPDFIRYHVLFGGDRENSLALCEWTPLQKFRRRLAHSFLLPRFGSSEFNKLEEIILKEHEHFLHRLKFNSDLNFSVKSLILQMTANIFFKYLCTCRFSYDNSAFQHTVRNYDLIFYDINQCFLVDFLPWLAPTHFLYFRTLRKYAKEIRQFIEAEIVEKHQATFNPNNPRDFVDAFLIKLDKLDRSDFTREAALFELEDLVGGHPGVANLCMKALGFISQSQHIQSRIFTELTTTLKNVDSRTWICLKDRQSMPFTEATVLETLRLTSSPIVPHVATTDTEVCGWKIDEGTIIIFNNYRLNMDTELWTDPEQFNPARFLNTNGFISKPEYFFPFSTGRRSCIGYRMVQNIVFLTIVNIIQHFHLSLSPQDDRIFRSLQSGCLALPPDTFSIIFTQR